MHSIRLLPAAARDLDGLEKGPFRRIKAGTLKLRNEPRPAGAVKLTAQEGCRIRIGEFRILYRVDGRSKTVFIYRVKHRKDACR